METIRDLLRDLLAALEAGPGPGGEPIDYRGRLDDIKAQLETLLDRVGTSSLTSILGFMEVLRNNSEELRDSLGYYGRFPALSQDIAEIIRLLGLLETALGGENLDLDILSTLQDIRTLVGLSGPMVARLDTVITNTGNTATATANIATNTGPGGEISARLNALHNRLTAIELEAQETNQAIAVTNSRLNSILDGVNSLVGSVGLDATLQAILERIGDIEARMCPCSGSVNDVPDIRDCIATWRTFQQDFIPLGLVPLLDNYTVLMWIEEPPGLKYNSVIPGITDQYALAPAEPGAWSNYRLMVKSTGHSWRDGFNTRIYQTDVWYDMAEWGDNDLSIIVPVGDVAVATLCLKTDDEPDPGDGDPGMQEWFHWFPVIPDNTESRVWDSVLSSSEFPELTEVLGEIQPGDTLWITPYREDGPSSTVVCAEKGEWTIYLAWATDYPSPWFFPIITGEVPIDGSGSIVYPGGDLVLLAGAKIGTFAQSRILVSRGPQTPESMPEDAHFGPGSPWADCED